MYRRGVLLLVLVCATLVPALPAGAIYLEDDAFQWTWDRTDAPVEEGAVNRTWIWGPAYSEPGWEPYLESPGGERKVQYFDKSRMEITDPGADVTSDWYVTNGLLVVELISGNMQLGNDLFEYRGPAYVNVAGDADDGDAVKYVTFNLIDDDSPALFSETIGDFLWPFGIVDYDPELAALGIDTAHRDPVTGHWIARPFWEFMNSRGLILDPWDIFGDFWEDDLFPDPLFATGRPITRAYWTSVRVAGTPKDVLLQCFERRCLTYTPDNPEGWKVEAGNVGQHYYTWRYESDSEPEPPPPPPPPPPPSDDGAPTEGGILYDKPMSQWPSDSDGWGNQGFPAGSEYQINLQPYPVWVFFTHAPAGSASFKDASYSVDVRRPSAFGWSSACMAVRATFQSEYELCLTFDDQSRIGFTLQYFELVGSNNWREEVLLTGPLAGGDPQSWHNLKLISKGQKFWVYIDGAYMGSVSYGSGTTVGGPIGVGGFNHEESINVTLAFRNFIVRSIE